MPGLVGAVGGILRRRAGRVGSTLSGGAVLARDRGLVEMLVGKSLDIKRLSGFFSWRWWLLLLFVTGLLCFGVVMVTYTWRSWNKSGFLTFRGGCRVRVVALVSAWVVIWLLWLTGGT